MSFLDRISNHTGLPKGEIIHIISLASARYKVYEIAKRSGGKRIIAQPAREVKRIQYAIIELYLSNLPVHQAAMAYREGTSIHDNAKLHCKNNYILKTDFKDFFNTIKLTDILHFFVESDLDLTKIEIQLLAKALIWRKKGTEDYCLSVGAPSSPMVSNAIMYKFDIAVHEHCNNLGVSYTRYADDITLSSNNLKKLVACKNYLKSEALKQAIPDLSYNDKKEAIVSKKYRRRVTGLILTNDQKVSVGHDEKRLIRAMVYRHITNHPKKVDLKFLRGKLAFVNSVEPDFISRLKSHYGDAIILRIMGGKKNLG